MSLKVILCLVVTLVPLLSYGYHCRCEDRCKGRCVTSAADCSGSGEEIYEGEFCRCTGSPLGGFCCIKDRVCNMEPVCNNTCHSNWNTVCEDGGEGSITGDCKYKTDCQDCGPRKDKCELFFGGVCRGDCLGHEFPREEPDLCTDGLNCMCCTPKCEHPWPPVDARTKCERSAQGHCVTHPIDCENFNVNEHAYNGSFADCNGDPQGRGVCCTDVDEGMEGFCDDTCATANNGRCEDGGPDSIVHSCIYGTDCTDCRHRDELCVHRHNGICRGPQNGCGRNEVEVHQPPGLALGLCKGRRNRNNICCRPLCQPAPDVTPTPGDSEDPRFVSIDGNIFHYEGICTYTLLRECEQPTQRPWFIVYVEHTGERVIDNHGHLKTYVKGAIAEIDTLDGGKHHIHFMSHGHVKINGGTEIDMDTFAGWEDRGIGLDVKRINTRLLITLDGYFTVSYNRKENVYVTLDEKMKGKVCGMMGDGDGDPDNDFKMIDQSSPSGLRVLQNPTKAEIDMFGDSWVKPGSCPSIQ